MSYIGNQPLYTSYVADRFSGNGTTLAYTLSIAPANSASLLVAIYGVLQDPSAYGVAGNTLTFTSAPPAGTNNISVRYLGLPASNVVTSSYRIVTDIIATAGQTTFSPASYTPEFIDVYRNGSKLAAADFIATNGAQVVLVNAAAAGDIIQTVSFSVGSVLNAIPANGGVINSGYLDVANKTGAGAMGFPSGTTAQRPTNPAAGHTRFNTETTVIEFYNGTSWVSVGLLDGTSSSLAAPSGTYLYNVIGQRNNGFYWIKPTGYSGSAFQVYIDFDGTVSGISGGGGWMRIAYSQDYYSQASPWTLTGIGSAPGANSVVFGLEFSDAQVSALMSVSAEARQSFTSYGQGSVGWTYTNANVKLGGYMTVKQWQDGTGVSASTVAGSDYWGSALSYLVNGDAVATTLNSFPNSGSDPTDINDATWRVGTIYIRDTSKTKLPIRQIANADVDTTGEARYFPLLSARSHTWCK
jgi:hypothetical protein